MDSCGRRDLRGSGQRAVFTPVTNICDGEGMVNRSTLDLDVDFLSGISESEDF